ncbi:phage holin family protein [Rarobacter faecitabidus]|uniref:Putative superfamily III holin-X n=1 Tax=Rarobacter faecitabidus TaxID=13243 RepID=A0A542ZE25_RARFA|nr:phage holin family protein [Rarobacter faecitabidus]TQL58594.1 putative superfamily III holin-X [Rarobacter faecitabidus]
MSTDNERPPLSAVVARAINAAVNLAKAEVTAYKEALVRKLKDTAVAIAMFAVAVLFLLMVFVFLNVAAYQALTLAFAGWLAALIMAGGALLLAAALVMVGQRVAKRNEVPPPSEVPEHVKAAVQEGIASAREQTAGDSPAAEGQE